MILVTGSTGHIGNVLIRKLVSKGKQVRAMVLPGETYHSLEGLDIEIIEGNVLDITSLERAFKDINVLYHLAGIISIIPDDEEKMWKVNVEGTRNVSEVAHKVGVNRMVHVSSIHAFERQPHGIIVDENTPLISPDSKTWGYDKTKAEGTHEVLKVVKKGLNAVIVCPTGIIGPYDFFSSETGQLIRSFTNKKIHPLIHGSYDFVDVRDVVNGLLLAEEKGRTGEIYILSGTNISLVKIKELVQEIIGIRTPHVIFPFRLALIGAHIMKYIYNYTGQTPIFTPYSLLTVVENSLFSSEKAESELGYSKRPIKKTIEDTIVWQKTGYSG